MATSGSIKTGVYTANNGTMGVKLSWSLKSQSIENNTSTISWTVQSYGTYPKDSWIYCYSLVVKLNGSNLVNKTSRFEMKGNGGYKTTGTIVVAHNTDGTKTFSMSIRAAIYSSSVNCKADGSGTPTDIPRYALISSADNFTDEVGADGYPTLVYTNPAGSSLVTGLKGRITWNSGANYTDWVTLDNEGGTYTFTSSTLTSANISSMLSSCTTSNTLPIQFDLQSTLGGTDYHNYKDATMTVVNADPTSQSLSYLDVNSTTVGKTGSSSIIVQSQSTLRIRTTPSTAKKSATISSYTLNINNTDYTPTISGGYVYVDFVNPSLSGTFTATMTTTDSRGNIATATTNIIVQPWEPPTALFTLARVNGFYTNTILYIDASMSSVSNTNALTIREQHREAGTSTWSTASTVQNKTDTTLELANSSGWEVRILVTDEYTTTTYDATVGKGIPIMFVDADMNSIGVNGYPDADNQIYVDGTMKSTGMGTFGDIETTTSIYTTVTSECVTSQTATSTTTVSSAMFSRFGRVCQLSIYMVRKVTCGGGGDIWIGDLGSVASLYTPQNKVIRSGSFVGARAIGTEIGTGGKITVRNASSSNIAADTGVSVTATWIYTGALP